MYTSCYVSVGDKQGWQKKFQVFSQVPRVALAFRHQGAKHAESLQMSISCDKFMHAN